MKVSTQTKVLLAILAIMAIFAAGRYSVKSTTVEKIVTIEVEKKEDTKTDTRTTIVKAPDGTETTIIDHHTETQITENNRTTDKTDTRTNVRKNLNLAILGSYDFKLQNTPDFGLSVSKEVLGPITIGAWGMKSGVVGLSVGMNF